MKIYLDNEKIKRIFEKRTNAISQRRAVSSVLYYIFLEEKLKGEFSTHPIVNRCLKSEKVKISDVFFEVTPMRDYFVWSEDKRGFNDRLLEFCLGWLGDGAEYKRQLEELKKKLRELDLGSGTARRFVNKYLDVKDIAKCIKDEEKYNDQCDAMKIKACLNAARIMMNATPDILIIYEEEGKEGVMAKALECELTSAEQVSCKHAAEGRDKRQFFIQECVMFFLFGKDGERREDKWKEIYGNVYEGILEQDWGMEEPGSIKNAGVELIEVRNDHSLINASNI